MNLFTRTFSKIFKSSNQQELDKIQNIIEAINNKENEIKSLTEADFKEKTFNFKKNAQNGTLKIDRAAPIYLSGLSINSAKKRLIKSLSKLYTGLLSSDELNKVELDLSLSKARSVVVNITGQVIAPGTYTISGFSSVLNALYPEFGIQPSNVPAVT